MKNTWDEFLSDAEVYLFKNIVCLSLFGFVESI